MAQPTLRSDMQARQEIMRCGIREAAICSFVVLAALFASTPTLAEEPWQFRLSPYAWLAGAKGNVGTVAGQPTVPIDVSPWDAAKDVDGAVMLMLDARKGRHGFLADLLYARVEPEFELLPPPIDLGLTATAETTMATLAYQYQLYREEGTVVDLLAGLRYWRMDTELRFSGGLGFLAGRSIRNRESWLDPAVGIKGRLPLGNSRFYFEGGAGIGGFNVGSDLFYEVNANVGYQWNRSLGTTIGYRMFDVDYENDGYVYDVRQQGWQLGLTWSF